MFPYSFFLMKKRVREFSYNSYKTEEVYLENEETKKTTNTY
jgi:hypothetical protein